MTDKEWGEFVKWWKGKWPPSAPDRQSVEQYLKYKKEGEQDEKTNME